MTGVQTCASDLPESIQSFEFDSAAEAKAFVRGACAHAVELGDGGADGDFYFTRDAKEARQLLKEAQSDDWDGYPYNDDDTLYDDTL